MKENDYDFIVIGAGVTGMSAAMYAARLGLKSLCLGGSFGTEMAIGGVITTTNIVENYPGFTKLSGTELAANIQKHAESYELVTLKSEKVLDVEMKKSEFIVKTKKSTYTSKTLLFATGTIWRKLEVPGSKEFENRGVAYCALCDAPLFRDKVVCVIGGSDSAIKDALVLAEHAKKVYIIYRGKEIRPEPINYERVKENKKIEVINETNVTEVIGKEYVDSVKLDKKYKGKDILELEGVFVAIGHIPLSDLAKKIGVKTNEKGEIIINHENAHTNLSAVYAAGDVADNPFKQAITGVSEGCIAAHSAFEHITKKAK